MPAVSSLSYRRDLRHEVMHSFSRDNMAWLQSKPVDTTNDTTKHYNRHQQHQRPEGEQQQPDSNHSACLPPPKLAQRALSALLWAPPQFGGVPAAQCGSQPSE